MLVISIMHEANLAGIDLNLLVVLQALLDERHVVRDAVAPIAEATRVRIVDEGGGYSRVVVVGQEGWLPSSTVLPIAKR